MQVQKYFGPIVVVKSAGSVLWINCDVTVSLVAVLVRRIVRVF